MVYSGFMDADSEKCSYPSMYIMHNMHIHIHMQVQIQIQIQSHIHIHGPRPGRSAVCPQPSRPCRAHVRYVYLYMYISGCILLSVDVYQWRHVYLLWLEVQYFQDPGSSKCLEVQCFQDPGFPKSGSRYQVGL